MKAVSDAFKEAVGRDHTEVLREVSYKRRYWSQADGEYVWEDDWTAMDREEVVQISAINGQLDTERLNEFQVSNVTLILKNNDNKWMADNPAGIFGQDPDISLHPPEPYFTKFRVRAVVRLADGTDEYVTMFTGVAVDYVTASDDQMQVTVQGLESLLQNANAENVSTLVTEENAGTGDGATVDFFTDNPGVGLIDEVSVAGIEQVAGTDYDVSDLDDPTTVAKITFSSAPTMGQVVRITYRYWHQNQSIEDLVADLLDEAGIPSVNQLVDPVIFANPIFNAIVIDSQADWQAGSLSAIETGYFPGSIKIDLFASGNHEVLDDFADGDFTANPVWTPAGNLAWSIVSPGGNNRIRYVKTGVTVAGRLTTPGSHAQIGEWSVKWTPPGVLAADKMRWGFIVDGFITDVAFPDHLMSGSRVEWDVTSGGVQSWGLYLNNVLVATSNYAIANTPDITIRVTRLVNGFTQVYVTQGGSEVYIMGGTSTAIVAANLQGVESGRGAYSSQQEFDDFTQPKSILEGNWVSPTYDLTVGVTSLGKLTSVYTPGAGSASGSVKFSTRTSPDGSTWDPWEEVAANGQVQSTVRRYLQVKVEMWVDNNKYDEPIVDSIRVEYQTTVTLVTMAKFTGKTVYEAIQEMGKFANYEWGFTADEDFFFRSKEVGTQEDVELLRERDISAIAGLTPGYDRVYSKVKVTYGNFSKTLEAADDGPQDLGSRFKSRTLEIDGGDIILGQDANVAAGIARFFFEEFSHPRKRFKAVCKFLPHVDLSDVALVVFDQNAPGPTHFAGDESHYAGETGLRAFGPADQLLSQIRAKVVGYRHDLHNDRSEFDLQEVF